MESTGRIKGIGIEVLRRVIKSKGRDFETAYERQLNVEERYEYQRFAPLSWRPVRSQTKGSMIPLAADMIFPGDSLGLQRLGRLMAYDGFTHLLTRFLRYCNLKLLAKGVPIFWSMFFDKGKGEIQELGPDQFAFVVRDYPEFPAWMREYMCGYAQGVVELSGVTQFVVTKDEADPLAWKWVVTRKEVGLKKVTQKNVIL